MPENIQSPVGPSLRSLERAKIRGPKVVDRLHSTDGNQEIANDAAQVVDLDSKTADDSLFRGTLEKIARTKTHKDKEIEKEAQFLRHEVTVKLQNGEQLTQEDRLKLTLSVNLEMVYLEKRLAEINESIKRYGPRKDLLQDASELGKRYSDLKGQLESGEVAVDLRDGKRVKSESIGVSREQRAITLLLEKLGVSFSGLIDYSEKAVGDKEFRAEFLKKLKTADVDDQTIDEVGRRLENQKKLRTAKKYGKGALIGGGILALFMGFMIKRTTQEESQRR